MALSTASQIPYRRLTNPIMLPYGTTAQKTIVPQGFIPPEATSFRATNRGTFPVRLKGTVNSSDVPTLEVKEGEGWLFPPGHSEIFTTQFPEAMSTLSVAAFGLQAGSGVLEISYGIGGGGASAFYAGSGGGTSGTVSVSNFPAIQQVADNGASLTVDTPQLPATLGTKTAANSLPVTPASDATFTTIDRGSASINTGQVTIAKDVSVQIVPARAGRRKVTLSPTSNIAYFVGNTGVSISNGFSVLSGGAVTLDTTAAIFVISGSSGIMTFVETF